MLRVYSLALGILLVGVALVLPGAFAFRQLAQTRNLHVVRPGVLYRSGQMTREGLLHTLTEYHIRTLINLRDGLTRLDSAEEDLCKSENIQFVRILPSQWGDSGGSVPVESGVRRFREIMSDPRNYPVLVHCFAGIHRTGAYCAIYRMEREHWSNARALAEMRACGYATLDEELDILGYLEQYRPAWMPPVEGTDANPTTTDTTHKHKPRKRVSRGHPVPRFSANGAGVAR
jgi:tyrosine-protein phosphatase SIW14